MQKNSKKGFTLVEIMIVVVIIGLLAAMAVPAFQQVRERSLQSVMDNDARQVAAAANQYFLESSARSVTVGDLINGIAVDDGRTVNYLSGIDVNKIDLPLGTTLTPTGTFTLSNVNVNNGTDITYEVSTGRRQPVTTTDSN